MQIVRTDRLVIRHLEYRDTEFIIKLLNQKSFIDNIGDKEVRSPEDAIKYLESGPISSYKDLGFGLNMVELIDSSQPIGMCGLIKREELDDVDIGYAFLPEYCGKGYALEATSAVLEDGNKSFGLSRIVAITKSSNFSSIKLLKVLGFEFEKWVTMYEVDNKLFAKNLTRLD